MVYIPGIPPIPPYVHPGYTIHTLLPLSDTGYTGPAAVYNDETLGSIPRLIMRKEGSQSLWSLRVLTSHIPFCAELLRASWC